MRLSLSDSHVSRFVRYGPRSSSHWYHQPSTSTPLRCDTAPIEPVIGSILNGTTSPTRRHDFFGF
jgi:hypothetical protein